MKCVAMIAYFYLLYTIIQLFSLALLNVAYNALNRYISGLQICFSISFLSWLFLNNY